MRKCESVSRTRGENELVAWDGKAILFYQETIGVMDMQLSIILLQGGLSDFKNEVGDALGLNQQIKFILTRHHLQLQPPRQ